MTRQIFDLAYNQSQSLDLHLVDQPGQPLVVCVHGGGFIGGSKNDTRCKQSASLLNAAGFNCASISYSLAPAENRFAMWPRNLFDLADSLVFLHDQSKHYGFDFDLLGMMGFSAGCCLSNLYIHGGKKLFEHFGYATTVFHPVVLVGFYGAYDFPSRQAERRSDNHELNLLHSPSYWLRQRKKFSAPPVLHIHGDRDRIVYPNQHDMFQRDYNEKGYTFEPLVIEGFGHTFAPQDSNDEGKSIDLRPKISRFLRSHLTEN
jgi:acetyl esterase/lipase